MPKISPLSQRIGARILRKRTRHGLQQATLARRARVSTGTLSTLERGLIADPGVVTLNRLAKALNVRLVTLVGD